MGTLYIVATPIGNLQDITLRALATLKSVDLILAEDTRRTGLLLAHYSIKKPLLSFHEHNENFRQTQIINRLKNGESMALVSDAGTPIVSDPGFKLIRASIQEGVKVVSIPGASSVLTALVSSGLPPDSFAFVGYTPKKEGKRKKFYEKIAVLLDQVNTSVIFFESPFRIQKTLEELSSIFPERDLAVGREMTKINEEFIRGKVKDIVKNLTTKNLKGEITLVLN